MIYVLYGRDEFSLHEELKRIKASLGDSESLATNTTVFEGKQVSLGQLLDACMALPFLGTSRLVIVEGLLTRFERGGRTSKDGDGGEAEMSRLQRKRARRRNGMS